MNPKLLNQTFNKFLAKAEIGFIIFSLLSAENTIFPDQVNAAVGPTINLLNYLFVGLVVWRLWKRMVYIITLDLWLVVLVSFAFCSILWSVDVNYSIRMALGMLRSTIFGVYLATYFSFQAHLKIFAWVSGCVVAVNLLMYAVLPSIAITVDPNNPGQLVFVGIYSFKQQAARIMAFAVITLMMYFRVYSQHRWLTVLGIVGAIFLLFRAHSSTYVSAVVIALMLLPLHAIAKQRFKLRSLLVVLILLLGMVFANFIVFNWESLIMASGKGLTFNGRTPVWTLAIEQLMKRPFFGYGYSAFWGSDEGWRAFRGVRWAWEQYKPGFSVKTDWTAHNGFLDLALQFGLVGLTILLSHILLLIYRAITLMQKTHSLESFWMLQLLAIQVYGNSFEPPTYLVSNNIHWIIYVSMAYSSALLLRRVRQRQSAQPMLALE